MRRTFGLWSVHLARNGTSLLGSAEFRYERPQSLWGAVGVALHELATNAGKYGALSTDAGRVDIGWGAEGDTFTISWTERDGPPVSAPQRRGFGTTVMEAMVERSGGGAVDLDYAPSGFTWRLACPAANALESQP